ncbi:MAG: hypothetical protein AAB225_03420 [Acidobacteriota bacterium]
MLVVISDIHFTDNGFTRTIPAAAFRVFRERLRDMAYDASWRAGGAYRPIEQIDLVLLGDILDVIRSERWPNVEEDHADYVRPWSDSGSPAFQDKLRDITTAVLERNEPSLSVLRSLAAPDVMTLPPATADGKVARVSREPDSPQRVPVKVRIHYMTGNHDWFFHLGGGPYNKIRELIVERMGLATPPDQPFPYEPGESEMLTELCDQHQVFFRHGDFFDHLNFHGDRDASSIGDAIVIDLLNRFSATVTGTMGDDLPRECLDGLRQIDHVRPLLIVPVWVDGLLRRTCADPKQAAEVKRVWDQVADRFLDMDFVRRCGDALPALTLDKLAIALKFSKGVSLRLLGQFFSWAGGKLPRGNENPDCADAMTEQAFKNRRARAVIYGHTHHHEIVPLNVYATAGGFVNQVYANTGTWRVVNEQARLKPDDEEFMSYWVMTYVGLYKGDERGGRPFEAWSGALALPQP